MTDPSPKNQSEDADLPLLNAEVLKNALEMTGCDNEAELIDMANVGVSLMERIDSLVGMPGPYYRWSPADDPAEIVFDLVNDLDELREENAKLRELLKPFARIADMEERAGPADSVMVNVALCREARAALATAPEAPDA